MSNSVKPLSENHLSGFRSLGDRLSGLPKKVVGFGTLGLISAALAMIGVKEFAVALVFCAGASAASGSYIRKEFQTRKIVAFMIAAFAFLFLSVWTLSVKDADPWTNLYRFLHRASRPGALAIDRYEFGVEPDTAYLNVFLINNAPTAIRISTKYWASIYDTTAPVPSRELRGEEQKGWALMMASKPSTPNTIPPQREKWMSIVYPGASSTQLSHLLARRATMLALGRFSYSDDSGEHYKDFCTWYFSGQYIDCKEHNN